jgi:hypothetical protein
MEIKHRHSTAARTAAEVEDKANNTNCKTWAGRWYMKYRHYKEIGKEIDERLETDGMSFEEIIARLEYIRRSIPHRSIQGLVDGLRVT